MIRRSILCFTTVILSACAGAMPDGSRILDAGTSDGPIVTACQRDGGDGGAAAGCDAVAGTYVPFFDGDATVVWVPSNDRYANEPTLVRAEDGTWHVFANSASGVGAPWSETQLIHATAPSLLGPWTEQPDALTTSDPGSNDRILWAPYVMRDGNEYALIYSALNLAGVHELHVARSIDLFHWRRTIEVPPGGRDPMVLRLADGRDMLYSVGTQQESDGIHDTTVLAVGRALSDWGPTAIAARNPAVCPDSCWGFYESPFVFPFGGDYYLFVTYTISDAATYERTVVFRSSDPTHFEQPPVAQLQAHGGEVHVEDGRTYLTRGGWTNYIGADRRGLSVVPLAWRRVGP